MINNEPNCLPTAASANSDAIKMRTDGFEYDDPVHRDQALARLGTMRKEGQFCDAVLEVGGKSVCVHRVVLASSNVFFFEFFSAQEEKRCGRRDSKTIYCLDEFDVDHFAIQLLVNYFYSARISCTYCQVWPLYKAAVKLKVTRVAEQCSRYLIQCLTPQNCLGTYRCALSLDDRECMKEVAGYIQDHVSEVLERSSELSRLPSLVVDIVGSISPDFHLTEQPLCKLVVNWLQDEGRCLPLDEPVEYAYNLVLTPDNKLIDSKLNTSNQDAKDSRRHSDDVSKVLEKRGKHGVAPGNKSPHFSDDEEECRMIASAVLADNSFMCIAAFDKKLANVSIRFRPGDSTGPLDVKESSDAECAFSSSFSSPCDKRQVQCLMTQLNAMSVARCGFGIAVVENNIVVVGGYGRGECLNSAESFSLLTNSWKPLKSMQKVRGRFSVGVVGRKLVACGGSDGASELNSVEEYDPVTDSWNNLPDMLFRKSSAGVAVCSGILYVIGGLSGSQTLSCCEMFDSQLNKWRAICPLKTGRSQTAACSYLGGNSVVALGGCNAWNCMNSCEVYDPSSDSWSDLPPLAISRRGAGAAYFKGMLYVIGGSDAQASLTSVEIYDPQVGCWFFGPSLGIPRANMGVTVLSGCRIFAVGGYSGKSFLKSLEYLAYDSEEWCSFLPADVDVDTILRASSPQARRRVKNGHRSSASSGTGSISSITPLEVINYGGNGHEGRGGGGGGAGIPLMNGAFSAKDANSDSDELSSACSAEELHKENHV